MQIYNIEECTMYENELEEMIDERIKIKYFMGD